MSEANTGLSLPALPFEAGASHRFVYASAVMLILAIFLLLRFDHLRESFQNLPGELKAAVGVSIALLSYPIGYAINALSYLVLHRTLEITAYFCFVKKNFLVLPNHFVRLGGMVGDRRLSFTEWNNATGLHWELRPFLVRLGIDSEREMALAIFLRNLAVLAFVIAAWEACCLPESENPVCGLVGWLAGFGMVSFFLACLVYHYAQVIDMRRLIMLAGLYGERAGSEKGTDKEYLDERLRESARKLLTISWSGRLGQSAE